MKANKNQIQFSITDAVTASLQPVDQHGNVKINLYRTAAGKRPVLQTYEQSNPKNIRTAVSSFLYSEIILADGAIHGLNPGKHHWDLTTFKSKPCHKTILYHGPRAFMNVVLTLERPNETEPYLVTLFGYNKRILLKTELPSNIITDGHAKARAETYAYNFLTEALTDYRLAYQTVADKKFRIPEL